MEERIIAACGNDCSVCPRYDRGPYRKTDAGLRHTAELWARIGYRDRVVTNEKIACSGCTAETPCRYRVAKCAYEKRVPNCGQCAQYPCDTIRECFRTTEAFLPACRAACTDEEYGMMKKAFFEKEKNLNAFAHREAERKTPGPIRSERE